MNMLGLLVTAAAAWTALWAAAVLLIGRSLTARASRGHPPRPGPPADRRRLTRSDFTLMS